MVSHNFQHSSNNIAQNFGSVVIVNNALNNKIEIDQEGLVFSVYRFSFLQSVAPLLVAYFLAILFLSAIFPPSPRSAVLLCAPFALYALLHFFTKKVRVRKEGIEIEGEKIEFKGLRKIEKSKKLLKIYNANSIYCNYQILCKNEDSAHFVCDLYAESFCPSTSSMRS